MYQTYIEKNYYVNRVCRTIQNRHQKMFVKRVLHPISMKHPNQFLIGSIGDRSGASFAVSYFSIEFRIDGRWVPAEILFDHRIAELEALM